MLSFPKIGDVSGERRNCEEEKRNTSVVIRLFVMSNQVLMTTKNNCFNSYFVSSNPLSTQLRAPLYFFLLYNHSIQYIGYTLFAFQLWICRQITQFNPTSHDIAEILLRVALNTNQSINLIQKQIYIQILFSI